MFSKWKAYQASRQSKKNERAAATIKNKKAIREDRLAALEFMKTLDDASVAVPALLQRFNFSLENGITDVREKELAHAAIINHGKAALPFIQQQLSQSDYIAWPIKLMLELGEESQLVDSLKNSLNFGDISFDQAAVDKNYDVLCYLRDYQLGEFADQIAHFLKDPDERVRFAAVEVLIEQENAVIPGLLESFIGDESAENRRIRQSVIEAFISKKWTVSKPDQFGSELIVDGVFLTKAGKLERRS